MSNIEPFEFQVLNRHYNIKFVYGVVAVEGDSGLGKSLFAKDLSMADVPQPYEVTLISIYNNSKSAIARILSSDVEWFKNKIMVVDDVEMIDTELLKEAVYKTVYTDTQWVLIGHGGFVGLRTMGAYRKLEIEQRDGKFYIKLVLNDITK
jgi:hypothetical protein